MAEESSTPQEPEAPKTPPAEPVAAAAQPVKPQPPPRELPSEEEIASWVGGADLPSLANLFNILALKKYDALVMQIRKAELVPQHWQAIASTESPDEGLFDNLPSVAKLRRGYRDEALAERRLAALKSAWVELRGLQPSLWTTPDLFAAMRRIIDKQIEVDFHDLLSAVRDVWRNLDLPRGRENLEILWTCLAFVRGKTKK
ncbi:MAG: hypothetical protein ACE5EG_07985 [Thermoanaerobaculia bacterium]